MFTPIPVMQFYHALLAAEDAYNMECSGERGESAAMTGQADPAAEPRG
jgi:hypothetical protein